MPASDFKLTSMPPSAESIITLRKKVGWPSPKLALVSHSIANTLCWACLYQDNNLIATGRIIGDGAMYFYIQDVVVDPDYQRQGLGHQIMTALESYLDKNCLPGATVGLLAAKGKEEFYQNYQYLIRNGESLGHGMCRFI